jgi:hypothetical protein
MTERFTRRHIMKAWTGGAGGAPRDDTDFPMDGSRLDLWDCWIKNPEIFEYALRHYPEVVDRWIADDPQAFERFRAAHPHVHYSAELQAKRVAEWDRRPCGSVISTKGRRLESGNIVFGPPKEDDETGPVSNEQS